MSARLEGMWEGELFAKNPSREVGVQSLIYPGIDLTHP